MKTPTMSNYEEESPYKKRKVEESPSSPFSWLSDDVAISCLARLSRTELAALSLVSKSCRSLVASSELYETRSLMGRTETYAYVCLRPPPPDTNPRWYILRCRETTFDLISIPSCPCQSPEASSVVALDQGIYVIGGLNKGNRTSDVFLLDCRTHTWRQIASMGVARASAAAAVVDGKIYVLGGCKFDDDSLSWGEVFDPKTQTWDDLPPMQGRMKRHEYVHDCVVCDGKVYAVDGLDYTFYYSPSEGKWGLGNRGKMVRQWCVVDNVIYYCTRFGVIYCCTHEQLDRDIPEQMNWGNEVMGLALLMGRLFHSRLVHFGEQSLDLVDSIKAKYGSDAEVVNLLIGARLINYGGNILFFWDEIDGGTLQIVCAEVSFKRHQNGMVWGNVESGNVVMTVDPFVDHYKVLYSVSVTL